MNEYQEEYEEINNLVDIQGPGDERYKYPDYQSIPDYYNNDFSSQYEKENNIQREINPKNNIRAQKEEYYNYYTESSSPYNDNPISTERFSNKKCYTPDRTSNSTYNNYNNINNNYNERIKSYYNIRQEYSNPGNNRINIRKRVYQGSHTPQPSISNNENYYDNQNGELIDNYQYHETKNIKNKGFKKYDSITHIIGYSNLIPLNRMKNIYGNDYKYTENYNNNYKIEEPKIKKTIERVQELQRGKREYDEFMRNLNWNSGGQNYREENLELENIRKERLKLRQQRIREERLKEEEELKLEKLKNERIREERLRKEKERMRLEKLKQERIKQDNYKNENKLNFKIKSGKYKYKKSISEDIDNYRNNDYFDKDKDNIRRHEIIHKNKLIKNNNKIPAVNVPSQNNQTNNNKIYEYKYLKKIKNNVNNERNKNKTIATTNSYRRNNISMNDDKSISKKSIEYISNYDYNVKPKPKNKIISLLKVQQKTASLNFPNQNKKVDTYGENFDNEKYKREYINVENVDDGKIENHIETGISKDGQYLISVTSAKKIYDENGNDRDEREGGIYERVEEIEETNQEREDNNEYEPPEKEVQEVISTITTKRRNLGDNYKYYESKHLYKPNVTSYTSHRKRTERTIYGNEEHESREVKRYKIRPQINEYMGKREHIVEETNRIPYEEKEEYNDDDDEYDEQVNYNYNYNNSNEVGDKQEQEGDNLNEEEFYEQEEEEAYY